MTAASNNLRLHRLTHGLPPQVVSVMLPSVRSQDGRNTSLTSLDHIYVVLLQPGESYTTYACSLDHLVFA